MGVPGKVPLVFPLLVFQVLLAPAPEPVKFLLFVQLHTHHHGIGHTLGAAVVVAGVHKAAQILPLRMIEPLVFRAVEHGLEGVLHLLLDFFGRIAQLGKYIAIFAGGKGTLPLLLHLRFSPFVKDGFRPGFAYSLPHPARIGKPFSAFFGKTFPAIF